ncbi:MAG: T9SS type A sorting domain-containing protein [Ignavibacteriales bacterium]|nr:MAG: T9SS type A sorting domain-containing protein [Ignavibacteriales bacterium]
MSDSLYNIGEYLSRSEHHPFLTADGKTMYFQANYDTLGAYHSVWESKMIIDENGDTVLTDIKEEHQIKLPEKFLLFQNYPNPFNPTTKIKYTVADAYYASQAWVSLKVFDILGNEVTTIVNEYKPAGSYEVEFQSAVGSHQLSSGVYYYQLKVGNFIETKKMILLK